MIEESAAVGVRVERPALRVDHPPRRVAGGVDVPQFLDPKAIDLRLAIGVERELRLQHLGQMAAHALGKERERKHVVYGKSVQVRVDFGGRRITKKKKPLHRHGEHWNNYTWSTKINP